MAKTPAKLVAMIERHTDTMMRISECLRVKREVPVENQASHISGKSEDYWIGVAHGNSNALESALFEAKCYAGFMYIASKPVFYEGYPDPHYQRCNEGPDHAAWRVQYFVKG